DGIPVIWSEPAKRRQSGNQLIIWLNGFSYPKEEIGRRLIDLSNLGFVAISFDPWQHGARGTETRAGLIARVFGHFRRYMWPIIGQSALDASRVIDWATRRFEASSGVSIGGVSMGGDVAIAAAGFDHRIDCVATIIATPDWLRPGMRDLNGALIDQGQADRYAQFFYDALNPLTHLAAYSSCPAMALECGGADSHVPAEATLRFQTALAPAYAADPSRLRVHVEDGVAHEATWAAWKRSVAWLTAH
ncbi:MAG TPA: prolyl oligopeptidase family serine peptidase, partial [Pseudomonadales bacterium]|nr:prolyl oligopeptidase family serine peptidase [Pseudomonadales bacterium]